MTVPEAIAQLWDTAGEPTDLNPWLDAPGLAYDPNTDLDPASEGVAHYLRILSQAQIILSNWKTRRNKPIRFKDFQVSRNVKLTQDSTTYTCTRFSDYAIDIIALPPTSYLLTDAIESAAATVTLTSTTYPGGIPTVGSTEDTLMVMFVEVLTATSVRLHFREVLSTHVNTPTGSVEFAFDRFNIERGVVIPDSPFLLLPDDYRNILKITPADSASPLGRAASKENLNNPGMTTGTPTTWYSIGKKIYFDVYFDEPTWFVVEYQKLPSNLTVEAGVIPVLFEIPEQWHEVLILIGEYQTAKRLQQHDLVAVKFSHVGRLIDTLRLDSEEEHIRSKTGGIKVQMEAN